MGGRIPCPALCTLLFALALAAPVHAFEFTTSFPAPRAQKAPKVDGRIGRQEWTRALRVELTDGSALRMLQDGTWLYLAIEMRRPGIVHVCVDRGSLVSVLHASAALGTAEYVRSGRGWKLQRGFAWSVRDGVSGPTARRQREEFIAAEAWLANPSTKPSSVREFAMRLDPGTSGGRLPIAVVVLTPESRETAWWPEDLDDGCREEELLFGNAPESLDLTPARWPVVKAVTERE